jgi:hypothetical protein
LEAAHVEIVLQEFADAPAASAFIWWNAIWK